MIRDNKNITFCPDPLLIKDILRLPDSNCFEHTVLDEGSCGVVYRIEALMGRLAPMGGDKMRCLWIETVRGDIDDWMTYEKWADGEDAPSEQRWHEDWLLEFPNEVEWFKVVTRQYRDLHTLMIGRNSMRNVCFENQEDAYGRKTPAERCDFSGFLLKLESYLGSVVGRIEADPDSYNVYVEENLSYYLRRGKIKASEWFRILPGCEIEVKNREEIVRTLQSKPRRAPEPMYGKMTLRFYMHVWRIAYDAFHEGISSEWNENYRANPDLTDAEMFERCPKGREALEYDLDTEAGFDAWWEEYSPFHCYDIVYARVHLLPQKLHRVSGCWNLYLSGDGEGYLAGTIGAAVALIKAGVVFGFDVREYVDYLKGRYTIDIDPSDPRSSVECPSRFLPFPGDGVTRDQVNELIRVIRWKKQKKVTPKKRK